MLRQVKVGRIHWQWPPVLCIASVLGVWLLLAAATPLARAEPGYPSRPVRIITPYGPGGIADVTMRTIAQKLSERLGQQFIVDNRPGAGGIIAAKAAATAAPDGYTLFQIGNGSAISKSLFKTLPFDVQQDFTPISLTGLFDLVLATKAGSRFKTVQDIVSAARAQPGRLNFGAIVPGSTQNLSAELFKITAKVDVTIITYRTTPELVTALLRGDVDVGFDYYPGFGATLSDHRLFAIATTGEKPMVALPEVPTVHDSGIPDYVVTGWNALSAPAGIPDDVVALLNREINAVLALPDVQMRTRQFGMDAHGTTPRELGERMQRDIEKWAKVIEKAGIEKQ
jgi:tripartite-type tricarboxylate transporter receptor subunit TctC